jgi:hypothetical protein
MRGLGLLTSTVVVLGFLLACTGEADGPAPSTTPLTLEEKVGAIAAAPDRAAALAEHGLTAAEYEAALFDIAADANRTRAYEKARADR